MWIRAATSRMHARYAGKVLRTILRLCRYRTHIHHEHLVESPVYSVSAGSPFTDVAEHSAS